jgi:hypothetical protein
MSTFLRPVQVEHDDLRSLLLEPLHDRGAAMPACADR